MKDGIIHFLNELGSSNFKLFFMMYQEPEEDNSLKTE